MTIRISLILFLGLGLFSLAIKAAVSAPQLEKIFDAEYHSTRHGSSEQASLATRLDAAVAAAGATREQIYPVLVKIIQDGYRAPDTDDGAYLGARAHTAIWTLGNLVDVVWLDRLIRLPATAPSKFRRSEEAAVVNAVNRLAPDRLAEVALQLARESSDDAVFETLRHIIEYRMPADKADRERRISMIAGIFREGIRRNHSNIIFLDEQLLKIDATYRGSEERRRKLAGYVNSDNLIVSKYVSKMLEEDFPNWKEREKPSLEHDTARFQGTATRKAAELERTRPAAAISSRSISLLVAALITMGAVLLLWLRVRKKGPDKAR